MPENIKLEDVVSTEKGDKSIQISLDELKSLTFFSESRNFIKTFLDNLDNMDKGLVSGLIKGFSDFIRNEVVNKNVKIGPETPKEILFAIQILGHLNGIKINGDNISKDGQGKDVSIDGIYGIQTKILYDHFIDEYQKSLNKRSLKDMVMFTGEFKELLDHCDDLENLIYVSIEEIIKSLAKRLNSPEGFKMTSVDIYKFVLVELNNIADSIPKENFFHKDFDILISNFLEPQELGIEYINVIMDKMGLTNYHKYTDEKHPVLTPQVFEIGFKSFKSTLGTIIDLGKSKTSSDVNMFLHKIKGTSFMRNLYENVFGNDKDKQADFELLLIDILPKIALSIDKNIVMDRLDEFFQKAGPIILKYINGKNIDENGAKDERVKDGYFIINSFWGVVDGFIQEDTINVVSDSIKDLSFIKSNELLSNIVSILNMSSIDKGNRYEVIKLFSELINYITIHESQRPDNYDNIILGLMDGLLNKLSIIIETSDQNELKARLKVIMSYVIKIISSSKVIPDKLEIDEPKPNVHCDSSKIDINKLIEGKSFFQVAGIYLGYQLYSLNYYYSEMKDKIKHGMKSITSDLVVSFSTQALEDKERDTINQLLVSYSDTLIETLGLMMSGENDAQESDNDSLTSGELEKKKLIIMIKEVFSSVDGLFQAVINNIVEAVRTKQINLDQILKKVKSKNQGQLVLDDFAEFQTVFMTGVVKGLVDSNMLGKLIEASDYTLIQTLVTTFNGKVSQSIDELMGTTIQLNLGNDESIKDLKGTASFIKLSFDTGGGNLLIDAFTKGGVNYIKEKSGFTDNANDPKTINRFDMVKGGLDTLQKFIKDPKNKEHIFKLLESHGVVIKSKDQQSYLSDLAVRFLSDPRLFSIIDRFLEVVLNKIGDSSNLTDDFKNILIEFNKYIVDFSSTWKSSQLLDSAIKSKSIDVIVDLVYADMGKIEFLRIIFQSKPEILKKLRSSNIDQLDIQKLIQIIKNRIPKDVVKSFISDQLSTKSGDHDSQIFMDDLISILLDKKIDKIGVMNDITDSGILSKIRFGEDDVEVTEKMTDQFVDFVYNVVENQGQGDVSKMLNGIFHEFGFEQVLKTKVMGQNLGENIFTILNGFKGNKREAFKKILRENNHYVFELINRSDDIKIKALSRLGMSIYAELDISKVGKELAGKDLGKNELFVLGAMDELQTVIGNLPFEDLNGLAEIGYNINKLLVDNKKLPKDSEELKQIKQFGEKMFMIIHNTIKPIQIQVMAEIGTDDLDEGRKRIAQLFDMGEGEKTIDKYGEQATKELVKKFDESVVVDDKNKAKFTFNFILNNFGFSLYRLIGSWIESKDYAYRNGIVDYILDIDNADDFGDTLVDFFSI